MGYKLYTDGSYSLEDEIAGYGGYIAGKTKTLVEFSEQIIEPENFKWHERVALKRGLELAIERKINILTCYTDDKSLAEQSQKLNEQSLENEHNFLNEIIKLKSQFKKITFIHIPRSENAKADKLSRKAIKNIKVFLKNPNISFTEEKDNKDKLNNYLVFHTTNNIDIFYITKDENNNIIDKKLVKQIIGQGNNLRLFINTVTEVIKDFSHIENLAISTYKGSSKKLENILKGKESIEQAKNEIRNLEKQLKLCSNLQYYNNPVIIKSISEQKVLPYPKTKEDILKVIKKLTNLETIQDINNDEKKSSSTIFK